MQTILVVEDNEVARGWFSAVLRREGYIVVTAANGEQALAHLRTCPAPDLIILDMLLPVLDGWHFLWWLRRDNPPDQQIPIVITTASGLTLEWAADHGCQGFIRKPFEADQLIAEVRRCLPASQVPATR